MAPPRDRPLLSERECQVVGAIADGLSQRQAAERMGVSRWSYRVYFARLERKIRDEAERLGEPQDSEQAGPRPPGPTKPPLDRRTPEDRSEDPILARCLGPGTGLAEQAPPLT